MTFVHQALTWGFLLALVPLLIHLINLMRRRRVQWAAMDFLMRSYKKHRRWIWLKQFLLLMMRMAAIALVVAMLAQWITQRQWLALFGSTTTHHFILLDDSYSMAEQTGGASAFDRAKQAIGDMATQAMGQDSQQKFTVIRFSRAAAIVDRDADDADVTQITDLNAVIVDSNFDVIIEEERRGMEVTELAAGPRQAMLVLNDLLDQNQDENNIVYVLSDFREKEWGSPRELLSLLQDADDNSTDIHFVGCIEKQQANLTLTDVQPEPGTRAAGVPLFVNISVRNNGDEPARKVQVKILTHFYDPATVASSEPGKVLPKLDEPPTILIEKIPAGETATRRVQVFFPQPGPQVVEAVLADDPVDTDNRRWCVINVAEGDPVLMVDGSLDQKHAYFLSSAFQPGQRTNTGVHPNFESPAFLRDTTPETLADFRVIYLLDVQQLDDRAIENLEEYVRRGGGVGIFVGEQVSPTFYTQKLFRDGEGFFPLPLDRANDLPIELLENVPDFEVDDHPVFSIFLGERNPFVRLVAIRRYLQPPVAWTPSTDAPIEILARLRNGDPLAVEKRFGDGRVIAFLTTLSPEWNNWAHDPSFVVAALKLQAYLAASNQHDDSRLVGSPISLTLNTDEHLKDISFVVPSDSGNETLVEQRTAISTSENSPLMEVSLDGVLSRRSDNGVARGGIYEAWIPKRDGEFDVRRYALNPDPSEGDLAFAGSQELLTRLKPLSIKYRDSDEYAYDLFEQAGYNRSFIVMCLLIALLLGEQLLAFSASYHPARGVAN
ncbi:MAG: BatA domain-containing protein [Planctomycetes bacterium]|nr:BatA domain-containing protein [Planctomycetota bacterium]